MSSSDRLVLSGCVTPTNPVISTSKAIWLWCGSKSPDTTVTIKVTAKAYNCGTILQCPIHISYQIDGEDVFAFDVPCNQTVTQSFTIPCKLANGNKHALNAWSNPGCIACTDAVATIEAPSPSPTPTPTPAPPGPGAPGLPTEYLLLLFMMAAVLMVVLAVRK